MIQQRYTPESMFLPTFLEGLINISLHKLAQKNITPTFLMTLT